jgi:hypothetical protein
VASRSAAYAGSPHDTRTRSARAHDQWPVTQIAAALALGEGTVRNHVSSILSKLGVADRTKAVLLALQQRLV